MILNLFGELVDATVMVLTQRHEHAVWFTAECPLIRKVVKCHVGSGSTSGTFTLMVGVVLTPAELPW